MWEMLPQHFGVESFFLPSYREKDGALLKTTHTVNACATLRGSQDWSFGKMGTVQGSTFTLHLFLFCVACEILEAK